MQQSKKRSWFGMFFCVVLTCMLALAAGNIVQAQDSTGAKDAKQEEKQGGIDEIEGRVRTLQEAIKLASEQLEQATQDPTLRLGRLDKVIETANGAVGELKDGGELFELLGKALEETDQKYNSYKDKSVDPEISAKIREQYDKLARRFETLVNQLYDKKILMNKQRAELQKTIDEFKDQRGFIADLIQANELEAANDALLVVLDSVKGLNDSITEFAVNMGVEENKDDGEDINK